jgi:hypothetical protein
MTTQPRSSAAHAGLAPPGRLRAAWGVAGVLYLAYAVIYTWPLALHPLSKLPFAPASDTPLLSFWTLGWNLDAIGRSPAALLTGRIFDANIFFPTPYALAYTDPMLLQAVFAWPLYAASGNLVACFNAVLFVSLIAGALAMFAYARALTGSDRAALVAGLCWGFWPYHAAHLGDLPRQSLVLLPLAVLGLHALVAGRRLRHAMLLGLLAGAQLMLSVAAAGVSAAALIIASVALLAAVGRWRSSATLGRIGVALVVSVLVVAPVAWPYLQVQRREGSIAMRDPVSVPPVTVASYVTVPPVNMLYGTLGLLPVTRAERPIGGDPLCVGFTVVALAAFGVWQSGWRRRRGAVWPLGALVIAGFVVSTSPGSARWLGPALGDHLFGAQSVWSPALFGVLVAFGVSGLAALGVAGLSDRRGVWIVALAMAGIEYANVPIALVDGPPARSETGAWLAAAQAPGPVIYLPLEFDGSNARFMVDSLQHRRPIINGYGSRRPSSYSATVDAMRGFPGAEALWALRRAGVRYVVAPREVTASSPSPLVERASFGATRIYELVWTAEAQAEVTPPELPAPPRPRPMALRLGESATYEVEWVGSGIDLPAGDLRMTVDSGSDAPVPGCTYRLDVMFSTAPWVSSYYDAQDRFTTWADATLMPKLHVEQLREGSRSVEISARFDQAGRVVRVVRGPSEDPESGDVLPLSANARDPVSAFFYARTRMMAPGDRVRIPVNHLGQALRVDLLARGIEMVTYARRREQALRVDVQIEYETEVREAPRARLWLSLDERRIPLVVEIDAAFGSVRATLVEHETASAPRR